MNIHPYANKIFEQVKQWRHYIHKNPELSLQEYETAKFVKSKLDEMEIPYIEISETAIVATIKKGNGNRAIGMRCELDALPMTEKNNFAHKSQNSGVMHACGHDGHTAMLLGACKALKEVGEFDGIIHLIFQPGEEGAGGAEIMIKEGLLEKCPMEEVYAVHNWPDIKIGQAGIISGPIMAATDTFEITLIGRSGHAAMPNKNIDPVVAGSHLITALQTIVSRNVDPVDKAVLSTTIVNSGSATNVISDKITISGTVRTFLADTSDLIEKRIGEMVTGFGIAFKVDSKYDYKRCYPATINDKIVTENADAVISNVLGNKNIIRDLSPCMGSEDFSYMLKKVSGNYLFLGNGDSKSLHNTEFDFNDELIPIGISYWLELAKQRLSNS